MIILILIRITISGLLAKRRGSAGGCGTFCAGSAASWRACGTVMLGAASPLPLNNLLFMNYCFNL